MKTLGDLSLDERKDLARFIVKNWMKMTVDQMSKVNDVKAYAITSIVARVRKAGVALPRKTFSSIYTEDFINELKKELQTV